MHALGEPDDALSVWEPYSSQDELGDAWRVTLAMTTVGTIVHVASEAAISRI
jgi:hypothetical protein